MTSALIGNPISRGEKEIRRNHLQPEPTRTKVTESKGHLARAPKIQLLRK